MSRYISVKWLEDNAKEYSLGYYDYDEYAVPLSALDEAPSIDIEPKRGEWKRRIVDNGFNADWVCSECGYRVKTDFVDYNFCPYCGADMRKESE